MRRQKKMLNKADQDYEEDDFDASGGCAWILFFSILSGVLVLLGIWKFCELVYYFLSHLC